MGKELVYTSEYPIRYVASEPQNQNKIVINLNSEGAEKAVYWKRMKNPYSDDIIDGIFAEVSSHAVKDFYASVHFTMPNAGRKQFNREKLFSTFGEAFEFMTKGIEEMEKILES